MNQSSLLTVPARLRVAVVSTVCLVMLAACTGGAEGHTTTTGIGAADETTGVGSISSDIPVTRARHVTVYNASFAGGMVAQHGPSRLWSGSTTNLGWLDPRTGTMHVVDAVPGARLGLYHGSLYRAALYGDDVARYDVSGTPREVRRQPAPSPLYITAGPHGVWASDHFHGNLLRLDPDTMKVIKKVPIGTGQGLGPADLLWQGKKMWVNVMRDQTVAVVDGRTGRVLHSVPLAGTGLADGISRTSAGIWAEVFHGDTAATLTLVDTKRLRVIARVNVTDHAHNPVEIGGETWVLDGDKLWHLSPENGWRPDRAVDLHLPGLHFDSELVAFGSLWISTDPLEAENKIIRVGAQDLD
jgi:DNA-binding beta-propeller fold protein YncE